jgi:hypothetical protein
MSSVSECKFGVVFEQASDGCCGTATGFSFGHPGLDNKDSRYYVETTDTNPTIRRIAGNPQAIDVLPESIALGIVGAWIQNGNINPLATTPPRIGETCTAR